jgi:hypothetical protein
MKKLKVNNVIITRGFTILPLDQFLQGSEIRKLLWTQHRPVMAIWRQCLLRQPGDPPIQIPGTALHTASLF